MDTGIYIIRNEINCKIYIGQSKSIKKRCQRHKTDLKCGRHKNIHLQRAYDVYGVENFTYSILESCDACELNLKEDYWVKILKSNNNEFGYNIRPTDINNRPSHSEETKEKIRKSISGVKHPEWRNKIKSISQSGKNHWTKKKNFSQEAKLRMSESQKNLYKNGYKHPNLKVVLQFTIDDIFIKEWESPAIAAKYLNLNPTGIANCARGKSNSSGKYKWKYK